MEETRRRRRERELPRGRLLTVAQRRQHRAPCLATWFSLHESAATNGGAHKTQHVSLSQFSVSENSRKQQSKDGDAASRHRESRSREPRGYTDITRTVLFARGLRGFAHRTGGDGVCGITARCFIFSHRTHRRVVIFVVSSRCTRQACIRSSLHLRHRRQHHARANLTRKCHHGSFEHPLGEQR